MSVSCLVPVQVRFYLLDNEKIEKHVLEEVEKGEGADLPKSVSMLE